MSHALRIHDGKGEISVDPAHGILEAYGTTVPADASVGYAPGCHFIHVDGAGEADLLYVNLGTKASSNFDPLDMNVTENAYLSGVTPGTVAASKAVVVDASKNIGDFGNLDAVNVDAGSSGAAGTVDIFPTTAAKGKIQISATDSAGDTTTTITNASQAAARTYTIPDAGASASFMMTAGNQTASGNQTISGTFTQGSDATDRVAIKGIYMSPANVSVTVPAITDPDIAKVDVDVSSAFSMQPAVGDAVIAIPQEAMEANARILGCYVTATDQITVVFGSEGGNVTGGAKNFKFMVLDVT